jgi:hypothetical protein
MRTIVPGPPEYTAEDDPDVSVGLRPIGLALIGLEFGAQPLHHVCHSARSATFDALDEQPDPKVMLVDDCNCAGQLDRITAVLHGADQ